MHDIHDEGDSSDCISFVKFIKSFYLNYNSLALELCPFWHNVNTHDYSSQLVSNVSDQ